MSTKGSREQDEVVRAAMRDYQGGKPEGEKNLAPPANHDARVKGTLGMGDPAWRKKHVRSVEKD